MMLENPGGILLRGVYEIIYFMKSLVQNDRNDRTT